MSEINLEKVHLQWFSAIDDAMHLEICQADASGKPVTDAALDPIITIRADTGDDLKLVLYTDLSGTVSIPLSEIERSPLQSKTSTPKISISPRMLQRISERIYCIKLIGHARVKFQATNI